MPSVSMDTQRTRGRGKGNGGGKGNASGSDGAPAAADLTIEQLAAEVGMSVRNIRNHHSRGLLPAPEVRARVGYYSAEHVMRLRLILDLQADGFNLTAIERLLSASGGSAARLLGLRNAMMAPFESETPEVLSAEELRERFGVLDARDIERIRKLKLLVALGEDRYRSAEPGADEGGRRSDRAGYLAARGAGADRAREPRLRVDLARVRAAVPEGAVGAVCAGGAAGGALG